jgi:hypothetical protein
VTTYLPTGALQDADAHGKVPHLGAGSAERMRRSRERQRLGQVGTMITLWRREVDRLVCEGYLPAPDRRDKGAIAHAVERLIKNWTGAPS